MKIVGRSEVYCEQFRVHTHRISGIEAMNILRNAPATKHIPIIALSANAMLRDIEKGLEAGFFRYLTKTHQD